MSIPVEGSVGAVRHPFLSFSGFERLARARGAVTASRSGIARSTTFVTTAAMDGGIRETPPPPSTRNGFPPQRRIVGVMLVRNVRRGTGKLGDARSQKSQPSRRELYSKPRVGVATKPP